MAPNSSVLKFASEAVPCQLLPADASPRAKSLRQWRRRALLRHDGRLDRGDRRFQRCGLRRQVLRHDGGIERGQFRIRQPEPGLILAEQRNPPIAAHRERLTVRADGHLGFIDFAVARIENVAVLIFQSVTLHFPDKGKSEQWRILAVVVAFRANLIGIFAWKRERLGDHALEDSIMIDKEEPSHRLAVLDLLPQPCGRGLGGLPREHGGEQHDEPRHDRQRLSKSGYSGPHCRYLSSPSSDATDYGHFADGSSAWIRFQMVANTVTNVP